MDPRKRDRMITYVGFCRSTEVQVFPRDLGCGAGEIDCIDELNTTEPDEDGNQWAASDLIHQEIMTARGGLKRGKDG